MVEYRPYLYALIGLTVVISLWEIAYVQWDYRDNGYFQKDLAAAAPASNNAADDRAGNSTAAAAVPPNDTRSIGGGGSHDRRHSGGERRKDGGGNRGILSSGKFAQDLSLPEDQGGGGGAFSALDVVAASDTEGRREEHKSDFRNLIDIKDDFEFLINQKACPSRRATNGSSGAAAKTEPDRLVTILVHSAPLNFRKRLTIRQTWGNHPDAAMKVYFILGAVGSPKLQFKLEMENKLFADLIQGNFVDAYRNMTYKHVMALKWFSYFCRDTPILLKTDDDVFVNTPALMEYVRENVNGIRDRRNFVMCKVMEEGKVKRSFRSKWRVSPKEYRNAVYPPYCPGFTILFSGDVVSQLYGAAQRNRYFWIDDVHVTGTLVQAVNGTLSPFRDVYFKKTKRKRLSEPYVRNMPLFTDPDLVESEIREMWSMVDTTQGSVKLGPQASPIAFDDTVEILAMGIESESRSGGEWGRSGGWRWKGSCAGRWLGWVVFVVACSRKVVLIE